VTVGPGVELEQTSPEGRRTWLAEQQTWLVVVLVSAQVVPLAFRQASLEPGKQLARIWLVVQRTSLEVVLAEPVWLAVQQISPEVARAEPVWTQVVPLAFRLTLLEQEQQLVAVDYDSAERSRQLIALPEQGEQESLVRLVSRQQSA
jgi:hypothetical protein